MTKLKLYTQIKIAWWLKYYLFGIVLTSRLLQREPNWQKVRFVVDKAVSAKITARAPKKTLAA